MFGFPTLSAKFIFIKTYLYNLIFLSLISIGTCGECSVVEEVTLYQIS